ncbi:PREDICTED: DNA repair protein RAD50 isoform X1 [Rhagoletis zephyria]|uniref:DNA repair protein RAD50 isoform X1 n=1 Tax=Rhagoletis zephyria TaxID=28612 RepID=UPI0008119D4F|nr:PREDICTED: DNA repair protein RAD50 isoform X1 [Rhagoletis zephyria]
MPGKTSQFLSFLGVLFLNGCEILRVLLKMSTIDKLSIQGIRSFGSNSEDVQTITFASPVTLLLGENGCGKTTVIECLKYGLTGEVPPGSDRGRSFVHDPKIFHQAGTLGQVKLEVSNLQGKRISVCRSMKISNKRGKYSFETLDATMNYIEGKGDGKGSTNSISKRCVDVDVAMCQFMGVSKAIINNVLFCHQEDSSWPLDESKKLKEKFDAIFGITEFNKTIERIIKMRKEEADNLKVKVFKIVKYLTEADLRLLAHLKQEMDDKSLTLKKAQEKCAAIEKECERCEEEMKPIDTRLLEIRNVEYEVGKYQAQKVEVETEQKNCQEQILGLSSNIKVPFEGSREELEQEISDFAQKMLEKRQRRNVLDKKVNNLKVEEKTLQKRYTDLDKKRILLMQQRQKEQECISKRAEQLKTLCQHLGITLTDDLEFQPESVPGVLEKVENSLVNKECDIAGTVAQTDQEDRERQSEIDAQRVELTKVEEGIVAHEKQKKLNEKELEAITKEIAEIETSARRIKILSDNIDRLMKMMDEMNGKCNQETMRTDIAENKARIVKLQDQFRELDERLTKLNMMSKLMAEISLKQKELEKKEQDVRRVKGKHADNFKKLLNRPVESNYRRAMQLCGEKLRDNIKELNAKSNKLQLEQQSFEIKRKSLKTELLKLEKELEEAKEKVYEACHAASYEDTLAKSKATMLKYQLEHGALLSAEAMYKRYIEKVAEDPCCPLCHKDMTSNEATDITMELSDEINRLPENIKRTEKLLKAEQKKYENLLQIKSVVETVAKLEVDIPKKKKELASFEEKLAKCVEDSESLQMLLAEPTTSLELADSMMGDVSLLDEAMKEVTRLKNDIVQLNAKLPADFESDANLDDLQMIKSSISEELDAERHTLEEKQTNLEKIVNALNKMQEQKNAYQDERIKLQEGQQSLTQLQERQAELKNLIESNITEIKQLKTKLPTLKQKLNALSVEKNRLLEASRKRVAKMQTELNSYKKMDHDIQRLNNEVIDFQLLNLSCEIADLKESIKTCKAEVEAKAEEISKTSNELEAIKTECSQQETLERDLKDNRELKLLQEKKIGIDVRVEALAKQLGKMDFPKLSQEKNTLIKQREKGTVRKGELLGKIGEVRNQVKKLESEINEPKFKDSLENYRRAFYEVGTSRQLIKDLGESRVSLEWSLMKFHAEKMERINRLIREYWRLIYRGNDIDYIQIQTDEVDLNANADRRRNYNYRVVQSKNSSEIEMRGRCSAGQRVLASLIIRMALAETFSSNCGVLALDEPTTNLDRNNILSLCEALNRIVDERRMQSNFMLIIITHDDDFISTLGKINIYHRVFRNDEGKSVIRKVKV